MKNLSINDLSYLQFILNWFFDSCVVSVNFHNYGISISQDGNTFRAVGIDWTIEGEINGDNGACEGNILLAIAELYHVYLSVHRIPEGYYTLKSIFDGENWVQTMNYFCALEDVSEDGVKVPEFTYHYTFEQLRAIYNGGECIINN